MRQWISGKKWRYWVTALPLESRAVWHVWGKGQLLEHQGSMRLFQLNEQWLLVEVGIGISDAHQLENWWKQYPPGELWNLGISGALISGWQPGDLAAITKSCDESGNEIHLNKLPLPEGRPAIQVTVAEPVMDKVKALTLHHQTGAALVDMELYRLLQLRQRLFAEVPFYSLRVVSDFADEHVPQTIRQNLPRLQQALRQWVMLLRQIQK